MEKSFRIDWLSLTIRRDQLPELFALGPCFALGPLGRGRIGYRCGADFLGGGRLLWDDLRWDCHLQLSGTCQEAIGLLVGAGLLGGRAARIDIAFDAPGLFDKVNACRIAGGCVSGFHDYRFVESGAGRTLYFGSRASECFVRCYEGAAFERDFDRLEYEFKARKAAAIGDLLASGRAAEVPALS